MEIGNLLNSLSTSLLLRWIICGAFFLFSYTSARSVHFTLANLIKVEVKEQKEKKAVKKTGQSKEQEQPGAGTAVAVILITGTTIYSVHRSVLYPVIEWFFYSEIGRRLRKKIPLISKRTISILDERWREDNSTLKRIENWSDFAHLQYASALAIGIGALIGRLEVHAVVPNCPLMAVFITLVISALVSDWRLHVIEDNRLLVFDDLPA